MATYSSILAWRIPWTEEPTGYISWSHKESDTTEQLILLLFPEPGSILRACKYVALFKALAVLCYGRALRQLGARVEARDHLSMKCCCNPVCKWVWGSAGWLAGPRSHTLRMAKLRSQTRSSVSSSQSFMSSWYDGHARFVSVTYMREKSLISQKQSWRKEGNVYSMKLF